MSEHDPLCPFRPYLEWGPINATTAGPTSAAGVPCQCDLIQQARNSQHDISEQNGYGMGFAKGYEQGLRDERKRSVLLVADAYGRGKRDAEQRNVHSKEIQ